MILLQIFLPSPSVKKIENRLIFGEVMGKSLVFLTYNVHTICCDEIYILPITFSTEYAISTCLLLISVYVTCQCSPKTAAWLHYGNKVFTSYTAL